MAFNWDVSMPGDSDIVSQHPANERSFRATVHAAFDTEHDAAFGRHQIPAGTTAMRDALNGTWAEGSLWVNNEDGRYRFQYATNISAGVPATWLSVGTEFPAGTTSVFVQATAPVGWVQNTSLNDRLLRATSAAGGGGGGSWTIGGMFGAAVGDHAHEVVGVTAGETANHAHGFDVTSVNATGANNFNATTGGGGATGSKDIHTHRVTGTTGLENTAHAHGVGFWTGNAGAAVYHAHTFDGNWRPLYVDIVVASKS